MCDNKDDALNIKKSQALETLSSILGTIKNSDEKAASLLTAAGIIFGLSAFSLDMLTGKTNDVQKVFINIFGCAYIVCFIALIALLVLVIFPRRKSINDSKKTALYYKNYGEDVQRAINQNSLKTLLYTEPSLEVIEDQIVRCSKISRWKENFLRVSVWVLVALTVLLSALIVLGTIK